MLAPGQRIHHYELVCPIGDGGMAHVWAARAGAHAHQQSVAKLFALKIIHSRFAEDEAFRTMFVDEARIVAPIVHRNVARVFDLGETGSLLYLVMEYVDGDSLAALIAPERTVPTPIAMRIAADACAGLSAVHDMADPEGVRRNIVHRDISPQNILLSVGGDVKVIDFGIAVARDRVAATTAVGSVKGKIRYMAPEQARREVVGPHTDVFGLGAVLFRMLAGRAPYAGVNDVATMHALIANDPPIARLPEDVPASVASIVKRAIAPNVRDRYATAKEMQRALEALLEDEPRAPDVAAWVDSRLTDRARERRRLLAAPAGPQVSPRRGAPDLPPVAPAGGDAPGFMDVRALVANARSGSGERALNAGDAMGSDAAASPGLSVSTPRALQRSKAVDQSGRPLKIAILAVVLVLVALGVLLLLPTFARDRAIAGAREAGIEITVDRVGVGFGGVALRGVKATASRTPGITATMQEVHLAGITGKDVRILGLDAKLEGQRSDIEAGLAMLLTDSRAHLAGTPTAPRHLSIVSARLTWIGIAGEGSRFSAGDVGLELDSRGSGAEDIRGSIGRFELKTSRVSLGPWSGSFESSPMSARVRLMFDPPVPDGPRALLVWGQLVTPELTITIPRSPFANLGIRPAEIGLPGDMATELETKIEGKFPPLGRSEIKGQIMLWGARAPLKEWSRPVDIRVEGGASGPRGKGLDLERTTVSVGPIVATLNGTITPHDTGVASAWGLDKTGLRLDAVFKTIPISCEKLAKIEAKNMGSLAATLHAVGQTTGALKVTGSANASGVVKFDTASPEEASVTWLVKETCGVSIFGM